MPKLSPIKRNNYPEKNVFVVNDSFIDHNGLNNMKRLKEFLDNYKFTKSQFKDFMENYVMFEEPLIRDKIIAIGRMSINGHLVDDYFRSNNKNVIIPLPQIYSTQNNYLLDNAIVNYHRKKDYGDIYCPAIETTLKYLKPQLYFMYNLRPYWLDILYKYMTATTHISSKDNTDILYLFERVPPLSHDIVVYRGTDYKIKSFKNTFISTSLCYGTAKIFGSYLYQIRLSSGIKVLPLFATIHRSSGEMEILLPPNIKLKITGEISNNVYDVVSK